MALPRQRDMNKTRISLLVVLLLTLAACGSEGGSPASGGGIPGESPTSDPDTPVTSDPSQRVDVPDASPSYTVPQPGQVDVRPIAWDSYNVGSDGNIYISYWSGVEPCYVLDRVEVDYAPKKVTVTLFEGHTETEEDVACIEIAVLKTTVITPDEPVGERRVVDGAHKAQG